LLIGDFSYMVDEKGRVFVPAKFREDLGESFVVTISPDRCLAAYSKQEWALLDEKISNLPSRGRDIQRMLYSNAAEVEPDKQGRIQLTAALRKYADLENKTDVLIVGASRRMEIWNKAVWEQYKSGKDYADVFAAMDELNL